jgi:hypothetical protein
MIAIALAVFLTAIANRSASEEMQASDPAAELVVPA